MQNREYLFDKTTINELKNLQYKEIPKLKEVEWRAFKIEEIFKVSKGEYLHKKNIIENGKTPYITAQAINNGVKSFIGNKPNFKGNSLTVEKVKLTTFYQPYDFYCSHDVSVLQHKKLNKFNSLFISSMINRQGFKYSYGRQAQMNVVKRETLFCPIKNNQPDWEYMEQFIKNIIYKKLQKFLNYKNF
ncbi:restriction endonuclease subunit S [Caminibacter profundus]